MVVKIYKRMINGCCNMSVFIFDEIIIFIFEKLFFVLIIKIGGCNNQGKLIVRYIGGGVKRKYCIIDFKCDKDNVLGKVILIEYDLNRIVNIVLIIYLDGEKRYIIVFKGL